MTEHPLDLPDEDDYEAAPEDGDDRYVDDSITEAMYSEDEDDGGADA